MKVSDFMGLSDKFLDDLEAYEAKKTDLDVAYYLTENFNEDSYDFIRDVILKNLKNPKYDDEKWEEIN